MYKFGEIVTAREFELIHGIKESKKRSEYMNWRILCAWVDGIGAGIVGGHVGLVQF